jgi:hypothetical protein
MAVVLATAACRREGKKWSPVATGKGPRDDMWIRRVVADDRGEVTFQTDEAFCRLRRSERSPARLACHTYPGGGEHATLAWPGDEGEAIAIEGAERNGRELHHAVGRDIVRERVELGSVDDGVAWSDGTAITCGAIVYRIAPGAEPTALGTTHLCAFAGRTIVDTNFHDGVSEVRIREVTRDGVRDVRVLDLGRNASSPKRPCREGSVVGLFTLAEMQDKRLVRMDLASGGVQHTFSTLWSDEVWCVGGRVAAFGLNGLHVEWTTCDAAGCTSGFASQPHGVKAYDLHGALVASGMIVIGTISDSNDLLVFDPSNSQTPPRRFALAEDTNLRQILPIPHGALVMTDYGVLVLDDTGAPIDVVRDDAPTPPR